MQSIPYLKKAIYTYAAYRTIYGAINFQIIPFLEAYMLYCIGECILEKCIDLYHRVDIDKVILTGSSIFSTISLCELFAEQWYFSIPYMVFSNTVFFNEICKEPLQDFDQKIKVEKCDIADEPPEKPLKFRF